MGSNILSVLYYEENQVGKGHLKICGINAGLKNGMDGEEYQVVGNYIYPCF